MELPVNKDICNRFALNHGQFFSDWQLKNQWWFLNGTSFGFGDLRAIDLIRINEALEEDEVFETYNEHHLTPWMTRENPTMRIDNKNIHFLDAERVTPETRRKVRMNWKD